MLVTLYPKDADDTALQIGAFLMANVITSLSLVRIPI